MKRFSLKGSLTGLLAVGVISLLPSVARADHFHGGGGYRGGWGHDRGGWGYHDRGRWDFSLGLGFGGYGGGYWGGYYPSSYYYDAPAYSYSYVPAYEYDYAPAVRYYRPVRSYYYYDYPAYDYHGRVTFRYR